MLEAIYGETDQRYRTKSVSVRVEDYEGQPFYKGLKKIYDHLTRVAGTDILGKNRKSLHQSDYYVKPLKMLVETDEDQHFTSPRLSSLRLYPRTLEMSYDRKEYMKRCKKLNRHDINPPHRDPQRAWYDTLRDYMHLIDPEVKVPTLRIITGQMKWCELDPKKASDRKIFKEEALKSVSKKMKVR
jgi:hypothetical protein